MSKERGFLLPGFFSAYLLFDVKIQTYFCKFEQIYSTTKPTNFQEKKLYGKINKLQKKTDLISVIKDLQQSEEN